MTHKYGVFEKASPGCVLPFYEKSLFSHNSFRKTLCLNRMEALPRVPGRSIMGSYIQYVKHINTPLEKQLDQFVGADEGAVCRKKDPAIVRFLTAGIKQVIHHTIQRGGFQPPDFRCAVLNVGRAGRCLGHLTWLLHSLSAQRDAEYRAILKLLTPLLNWVLI